jgi:hypothetical protein
VSDPSLTNAATRAIASELDDRRDAYDSLGYREVERRVLAIRGDRLALSYQRLDSIEGLATVEVRLAEVDGSGLVIGSDVYDDRDLPRALADLDARYRVSAEVTEAELIALDALDALNRRDGDALEQLMEAELVAVDHEHPGSEPAGRDRFLGWLAGLVADVPDAVSVMVELRGRGPALFCRVATVGTTVDGDVYERDSLCVARFGRGARLELFPLDRRREAIECFDAWTAHSESDAPETAGAADEAGFAAGALWTVLDRHDVDGLDGLVSPTVTFADHVENGLPSVRSAVHLGRVFRRLFDLAPDTRFAATTPSAAGVAAMLDVEQRSTTPSGTEYRWDRVVVIRCAADGRIDAIECFPVTARAEAAVRYDEWRTP